MIDGHNKQLNIFSQPVTNSAVIGTSYVTLRPTTNVLSNMSVLEFHYPCSSKYVDLSETRLYIKLRIVDGYGDTVKPNSNVGFINNPLASLFSNVELLLNNVPVSRMPNNIYPIQSYVDIVSHNMESSYYSFMSSRLFSKDTAGYMDDCTLLGNTTIDPVIDPTSSDSSSGKADPPAPKPSAGNNGFSIRGTRTESSKIVELYGGFELDVMQIQRYMLSNVSIAMKLYQADEAFRLSSSDTNPNYKVQILDCALLIKTVHIAAEIILAQEAVLKNTPATYPYWSNHYRTFTMSKSDQNLVVDSLFGSRIPSKVFIVMLTSQAFSGCYRFSPLNFQTFGLNRFSLSVDGAIYPSGRTLAPDFDEGLFQELYVSFIEATGNMRHTKGPEISFDEFARGYCILAVDIDGHPQNRVDYIPIEREGIMSLELGFSKALEQSINVIVIGQLLGCIRIDSVRNVSVV